jgi:hypothetical protein
VIVERQASAAAWRSFVGPCLDKGAMEYDIPFTGPGSSYRHSQFVPLAGCQNARGVANFDADRTNKRDRFNLAYVFRWSSRWRGLWWLGELIYEAAV